MRRFITLIAMLQARASIRGALPVLAMVTIVAGVPQIAAADGAPRLRPVIEVPYSFLNQPPIPRTPEGQVDGYRLLVDISLVSIDNFSPPIQAEDIAEIVDALLSGNDDLAVSRTLAQFFRKLKALQVKFPHGNINELVFLVMRDALKRAYPVVTHTHYM